jgi:hypothetical protein
MRKPNLADALNIAAGKPVAVPAVTPGTPGRATPVPPSRSGKRAISGHFDPAVGRQLRQLALDRESSVQALLGEALSDLFQKYGRPPIA